MGYKKMVYQNSVTAGGRQWFWCENFNALFQRDLDVGILQKTGSFWESGHGGHAAYSKLAVYQNKLIGLPCDAEQIMIYDMERKAFRYVPIGIPEMEGKQASEKFFGAVVQDRWLFMIGCKTGHILKFDMEREQTAGYVDLQAQCTPKPDGMGYLREGILWDHQILVPALYENCVFEIDVDTLRYTRKEFVKEGEGFSTLCAAENEIWLFPFDEGRILQWNKGKNRTTEYTVDHLMKFVKGNRNFLSAGQVGDQLWIFPRLGSRVLSFDMTTGQFSDKNAVNTYLDQTQTALKGIAVEQVGQGFLFLTEGCEELLWFEPEKEQVTPVCNEISEAAYRAYCVWKKEPMLLYEKHVSLTDFLAVVQNL